MRTLARFTTSTWVLISFLFVLLIGANTYLSRSTITELNTLQQDIRHSADVIDLLQRAHTNLLTAESGQRGFLITQDEEYLRHYKKASLELESLSELSPTLFLQVDLQSEELQELFKLVKEKTDDMDEIVAKAQNDNFRQAIRIVETDEGRVKYTRIRQLLSSISSRENASRAEQITNLQSVTQESQRNVIISFFTSVLLVLGLVVLARANLQANRERQHEIEAQNTKLTEAVSERTRELSIFSDELARSNRELEDFAFVASHDLQEPLRKITAFGDRLETSDNLSDKQHDYLQRMRSAASRMSTLINDLLEFSRITTRGKEFQDVDLNTIIEHSVDDLDVLIEETAVEVVVDKLPEIIADPTQMRQLFFNLIANGIKFSSGEKQSKVHVSAEQITKPDSIELEGFDDWYKFSIVDNGIGFDQEYAEKIFAPFQRLHSRQEYKGTGIGLAICRRIVERHNGLISAIGKSGEGAIFEICLPAKNYLISIKQ